MKRIVKYIGFYNLIDREPTRVSNLAAVNKMNYIAEVITKVGYKVNIISPSWIDNNSKIMYEGQTTDRYNENIYVTFCPSWRTGCKLMRNIKIIITLLWLLIYLLINTKRNEKIIVYHVQWLTLPLLLVKQIKNIKLILEVEEVYQDVQIYRPILKKWEDMILESADGFIVSTEKLLSKLDVNEPYVVIYGNYNIKPRISASFSDGKIHLLYAGIIDREKGGAIQAIKAARYLGNKYHLHIIGFGEIDYIKSLILKHNENYKSKITYDGLRKGKDYIEFSQSCDIGLSTQKATGKYLESSFPSKILSYLTMGLPVVSADITCVKESDIGRIIYYYKDDRPESIAETIKSIDLTRSRDTRNLLIKLDKKARMALCELIK